MKKLGKSTLEELAKRMPVLTENEQRSSIGGYRYYDESGNFLGEIGSHDTVRITSRDNYNVAIENGASSPDSIDFSSASDDAKSNIIKSICAEHNITVETEINNKNPNVNGTANGERILINITGSIVSTGHYYDIVLIAVHEQDHMDTRHDTGNKEASERTAWQAMRDHEYFWNASMTLMNKIYAETDWKK